MTSNRSQQHWTGVWAAVYWLHFSVHPSKSAFCRLSCSYGSTVHEFKQVEAKTGADDHFHKSWQLKCCNIEVMPRKGFYGHRSTHTWCWSTSWRFSPPVSIINNNPAAASSFINNFSWIRNPIRPAAAILSQPVCACACVCAAVRKNNVFRECDADHMLKENGQFDAINWAVFWLVIFQILLTFSSSYCRIHGLNLPPQKQSCAPLQVSQVSLQVLQKWQIPATHKKDLGTLKHAAPLYQEIYRRMCSIWASGACMNKICHLHYIRQKCCSCPRQRHCCGWDSVAHTKCVAASVQGGGDNIF